MCGLCGVLSLDGSAVEARVVEAMTARLTHRGPDQGAVIDRGGAVLGNRRLAILDLSPAGALPMASADGKLTLAYNGEIYNYRELRAAMERDGTCFRSHSDAEVILALYRQHGGDAAMFAPMRGMFALGLWDSEARTLLLARDRLGEKPLYYYRDARRFVFASEIKALLAHPDVPRESALDARLLALYLAYGCLPAPLTAFKGIRALLPGHWLRVRDGMLEEGAYWTPPPNAPADPAARVEDHLAPVRDALDEAVRQSLISDVPLGAFLSGGLDSSLIVAMMQQHSRHVVKTFSIGFEGDASFDETRYAQQVADYLGTQHTAFTVQPHMLDLLPKLVWHHDQPFGDSSAIPTYLVSKLAREHVTVAITGDGGDELFAGYDRFRAAQILTHLQHIPKSMLRSAVGLIDGLPETTGYADRLSRARRFLHGALLPQTRAYFDWVRLFSADVIRALVGLVGDVGGDHFVQVASRSGLPGLLDANLITYLPDDLLVKVDRSSMAASLETRAPFLDHLLVERAARVPFNLKLRGMMTKYLLKTIARAYLPDAIIDRPKHGFGVPLGAWLRRDSSLLYETLLSRQARERGLLDAAAVSRLIDAHVSGQRDHGGRLWTLLTLEWWYRLFIDGAPPSTL